MGGTPTPDVSRYFDQSPASPPAPSAPSRNGGTITGPTFDQGSGLQGSQVVPQGFVALGGDFAGYYYNPTTQEWGASSPSGSDVYGNQKFDFQRYGPTSAQAKSLSVALNAAQNPIYAGGASIFGNSGSGSGGTGGTGGGGGPGAPGGITQYESGQLALGRQQNAEQARADRVTEAINYINQLVGMSQNEQAQQQAASKNVLDAAQWALPAGQDYMPGFGPNDPAVTSGLATMQKIARIPFDPYAVLTPGPNQQAAQAALAQLHSIAAG